MSSNPALQQLRVSIAMCTFNAGKFLQEQLQSIQAQTLAPSEMVVCDDGSSDTTIETLEQFRSTVTFPVRIERNARNLGYSKNFAKAIALCTGEIVALSDQDDRWNPQKLGRLQAIFAADKSVGGVFSDGDLIDTESHLIPGTLWQSFNFHQRDQHRILKGDGIRVLLRRNVVTGMALAFRREWGATLHAMPARWPHDFWLAMMLAEQNALRPCPDRLVAYRIHSNQQVGVPITSGEKLTYLCSRGPGAYLQLSRERNEREYRKNAEQFEALLAAAAVDTSFQLPLSEHWWLKMAEQKADHMRRGASQWQRSRLRRSVSALYHWKSYRDFAPTGLSSLLRDLLL